MTLIKYDPFRSIFDYDFAGSSQNGIRVHETKDGDMVVEAVVAGIPEKNVDINIEDGVLTIKAELNEENSSYKYYYTTALSGGQWDKAEAEVVHGIVKVTIPKAESAKPRKIEVKAKAVK